MRLRLEYPPTCENMPRHGAICVQAAKGISNVDLEYSPSSLELLDSIIEEVRNDGIEVEHFAETLFTFGCYVGEVFVRNAGGKWMEASDSELRETTSFPVIEVVATKMVCNPIGKVFKRFENGIEDYLPYFYEVFTTKE